MNKRSIGFFFISCILARCTIACSSSPTGTADSGPAADHAPLADAPLDNAGEAAHDLLPDSAGPTLLQITVNRLPQAVNGTLPFTNLQGESESFNLALPRHGFSVDLSWSGGPTTAAESMKMRANVKLGQGTSAVEAGQDLAFLCEKKLQSAHLAITEELALPEGMVTFTAEIGAGSATQQAAITVEIVELSFLLHPFRLPDTWLLVFSEDHYTISKTTDSVGLLHISSELTPNGEADFAEDLQLMGLGTKNMTPQAEATQNLGVTGTNAIVRRWIEQEILTTIYKIYLLNDDGSLKEDSVRLQFFSESMPGAPIAADFVPQVLQGGEQQKHFSIIAIGGGDVTRKYIGYSKTVDLRNVQNEANVGPQYGVFPTRAIAMLVELMNSDPTVKSAMDLFFGDFLPELALGGKPVGEHALDPVILAAGFDVQSASPAAAARFQKLSAVLELLGRLLGAVTAHEIGHSLGLVANGPPPRGLFGGEKNAAFVESERTTSVHIDTAGFNLMEAGPGSTSALPQNPLMYLNAPTINPLNLAYLQGRVVLQPE